MRLGNEAQKRKIMERKFKLRGRKEKILEDWTWKERKMRWKLEEIARKEMWKGRKVWLEGMGWIRGH